MADIVFQRTPTSEPVTTSDIIAEHAGINSSSVIKLIERYESDLEALGRVGFEIQPFKTRGGLQNRKIYYLNEQQATLLFTYFRNTPKVREFKIELVRQFFIMRNLIIERSTPIWNDTRKFGKAIRKSETDTIKQLVDYAKAKGSRNAERYFTNISNLANKAAGVVNRDTATTAQLLHLYQVEAALDEAIKDGIKKSCHTKRCMTAPNIGLRS